jgi:DNA-binding LacI/PurR family transcriptional regulator
MPSDSGAARSPGITDVAKLASVSHVTVSRVLHDHPNVRPQTRERVLAAIDELGYRPNLAARALVTGRSNVLGLITLNTTLVSPPATLYGIEQAARSAGYSLTFSSVRMVDRRSLGESVARLLQQAVAGVIIIAPVDTHDSALAALPPDLPAVLVEANPDSQLSSVLVDQEQGAYLATKHLLELGHHTVVHLAGPEGWIEARQRIAGWQKALDQAGSEIPKLILGDWSAKSGYDAGLVLGTVPEVTAVFVASDSMALGLLRALSEQGRSVPEDVSIVGFDDIPEAAYFTPPLTTVRQDFVDMGRRAVELLLRRVKHNIGEAERIVLEPELVLRQSTAPANSTPLVGVELPPS